MKTTNQVNYRWLSLEGRGDNLQSKMKNLKSITGRVLFEYEDNLTIRQAVELAVKNGVSLGGADLSGVNLSVADLEGADLSDADLRGAYLWDANLSGADLRDANLSGADLRGANLRYVDLRDADLRDADLSKSNLEPIKADLFKVLAAAPHEVAYLKQAILDGKIDGSVYEGDCVCLSGTLEKAVREHNGPKQDEYLDAVLAERDSSRPIEKFFLAIRKGDTPNTNQVSKLVLEWVVEFESMNRKQVIDYARKFGFTVSDVTSNTF